MFVALFLLLVASQPDLFDQISSSGRCTTVGETPDQRVNGTPLISPGAAPVLMFRYFEDRKHHRFDNQDVMLDDAGH